MANGFRNDCEERWACFFTEMGWLWDYQNDEDFITQDGVCYVPTFDVRTPGGPTLFDVRLEGDTDLTEVIEYATEGFEVIVVTGNPSLTSWNWQSVTNWRDWETRHDRCMWSDALQRIVHEDYSGAFDDTLPMLFAGQVFTDAATEAAFNYICEGEVA